MEEKRGNDTNPCESLFQDFSIVRDHLWSLFESKSLEKEYEDALRSSMEKRKKTGRPFDKKVSLQSFFCQTMETKYLLQFVAFLRKKYSKILEEEGIYHHNHYFPITDKEVDLPAIYSLSIVPFLDGAYISSSNRTFNRQLDTFVNEFNTENSSCIRFTGKEIKRRESHITD